MGQKDYSKDYQSRVETLMMIKSKAQSILTEANIDQTVGKTIIWWSPADPANGTDGCYYGKCKVLGVDLNKRNPLSVDVTEGENLNYAFIDDLRETLTGSRLDSIISNLRDKDMDDMADELERDGILYGNEGKREVFLSDEGRNVFFAIEQ